VGKDRLQFFAFPVTDESREKVLSTHELKEGKDERVDGGWLLG
jgi:hypothetical protein